jgi:hypothetical protein
MVSSRGAFTHARGEELQRSLGLGRCSPETSMPRSVRRARSSAATSKASGGAHLAESSRIRDSSGACLIRMGGVPVRRGSVERARPARRAEQPVPDVSAAAGDLAELPQELEPAGLRRHFGREGHPAAARAHGEVQEPADEVVSRVLKRVPVAVREPAEGQPAAQAVRANLEWGRPALGHTCVLPAAGAADAGRGVGTMPDDRLTPSNRCDATAMLRPWQ